VKKKIILLAVFLRGIGYLNIALVARWLLNATS